MGTSNQGLVAMPRLSPKSMAPAEKPNPSLMPRALTRASEVPVRTAWIT